MVTVTQNDVAITGRHLSFGATTDIPRPYKWHWRRDGVLIAGAQSARAYTTPPLRPEDIGHHYSCTVYGLDGEVETSDEVELSGPKPVPVEIAMKVDVDPEGDVT